MAVKNLARQGAKHVWEWITHAAGRCTKRYYFEDFIRVYPDGLAYNRLGFRKRISPNDTKNFLNHCKFYAFAAQFVGGKSVVDVGCGSGYGCQILMEHGAGAVHGCDISRHAIRFAKDQYGEIAEFTIQGITELSGYRDSFFDVTISSEVLEHIKEYHLQDIALQELKRVTRAGGVIVVGTPNAELLKDHGFSYEEIRELFSAHFNTFCIFENALIPSGEQGKIWETRAESGRMGVVVSERINLNETVLPENEQVELKRGLEPGKYQCGSLEIDTTLLHNTHSWIIVAMK